jgi:hypothetical protein
MDAGSVIANFQYRVSGFSFTGPGTAIWAGGMLGDTDAGNLSDDIMIGSQGKLRFISSCWRFHHNIQKNSWKLGQLARI